MPPKRTYNKRPRRIYKKYGGKARVLPAVRTLQAAARRAVVQQMNKHIETKQSVLSAVDGQQIFHNNFITLDNVVLQTTQGVTDPLGNNNTLNRIGDQISLKGVAIKMMVELNERYSDVTFRMMLIKASKGDLPTRATLWKGQSENKMLDVVNNERYSILFQKVFKIRAANVAASNGSAQSTEAGTVIGDAGIFYGAGALGNVLSRATRIVKVWIPGTKFTKSGIIQYENGTGQTKFFDYHVVLYAYSNYSTAQDIYYVGRLSDYVKVMYYKDA